MKCFPVCVQFDLRALHEVDVKCLANLNFLWNTLFSVEPSLFDTLEGEDYLFKTYMKANEGYLHLQKLYNGMCFL